MGAFWPVTLTVYALRRARWPRGDSDGSATRRPVRSGPRQEW